MKPDDCARWLPLWLPQTAFRNIDFACQTETELSNGGESTPILGLQIFEDRQPADPGIAPFTVGPIRGVAGLQELATRPAGFWELAVTGASFSAGWNGIAWWAPAAAA